jgi:hypothetical protein
MASFLAVREVENGAKTDEKAAQSSAQLRILSEFWTYSAT